MTAASRITGKPDSARAAKNEATKNRIQEIEHDEQQKASELALEDSPVLTANGVPDMRFKENRKAFLFDRSKTVKGTPDNRMKRNRPDIQRVHEQRGDDYPNVRFIGPGKMKEEQEDNDD